jgi:hypothetical protein
MLVDMKIEMPLNATAIGRGLESLDARTNPLIRFNWW